jgi:molybdenum-dependent DNA-binding transcriptional regulator ModE
MFHHDLHSLRLFVAVCELRSLSRAAERMNMALSAASRRLKLFEEEIGAPLVKRLPHGLELTTAGFTAERYAQSVLQMADQLAVNMDEHRSGVRGRIRVAASSSALVQKLAADLAGFARDNPDIKIDLEGLSIMVSTAFPTPRTGLPSRSTTATGWRDPSACGSPICSRRSSSGSRPARRCIGWWPARRARPDGS